MRCFFLIGLLAMAFAAQAQDVDVDSRELRLLRYPQYPVPQKAKSFYVNLNLQDSLAQRQQILDKYLLPGKTRTDDSAQADLIIRAVVTGYKPTAYGWLEQQMEVNGKQQTNYHYYLQFNYGHTVAVYDRKGKKLQDFDLDAPRYVQRQATLPGGSKGTGGTRNLNLDYGIENPAEPCTYLGPYNDRTAGEDELFGSDKKRLINFATKQAFNKEYLKLGKMDKIHRDLANGLRPRAIDHITTDLQRKTTATWQPVKLVLAVPEKSKRHDYSQLTTACAQVRQALTLAANGDTAAYKPLLRQALPVIERELQAHDPSDKKARISNRVAKMMYYQAALAAWQLNDFEKAKDLAARAVAVQRDEAFFSTTNRHQASEELLQLLQEESGRYSAWKGME